VIGEKFNPQPLSDDEIYDRIVGTLEKLTA
jgi:hypothetical protein